MALIATINGLPVYSDKQPASINGTRIGFADGSWCDVSTGKVHNVGSGFLNIGGTDEVEDAITEGPRRVSARALEVLNVAADVHVGVHKGSDIEYVITGPAGQVKTIRANVQGDTLVIEGDGDSVSFGGGSITISQAGGFVAVGSTPDGNVRTDIVYRPGSRTVIRGSNSVAIGKGSIMSNIFGGRGNTTTVITGGDGGANAVKIDVKVPQGTPLTINRVSGTVKIGNTEGPLAASVQAGDLHAGRVTSAQLVVQGSGDILIGEVNGAVSAQVQGSGDIEIERGSMSSLTATVQGSGDIEVGGSAMTATLTVMGSGDIKVAHVQQRPMKSVMGSGDIKIKRVG